MTPQDPAIHMCVDVPLSDAQLAEALALAEAHNPDNRRNSFELGGYTPWLWRRGETLRVSFLGGDEWLHERVRRHAVRWCDFANIRFDFLPYTPGKYPPAPIRVAFVPNGLSWSLVGAQALVIKDMSEATMNLGWLATADETEARRVVLHEFGHALGCIHEHLHPQGGIPWKREAVYAYYRAQGWSDEKVDANVFNRYEADYVNGSGYDPLSIMHYHIPAALRTDGRSTPHNTDLSAADKAHIGVLYPREG